MKINTRAKTAATALKKLVNGRMVYQLVKLPVIKNTVVPWPRAASIEVAQTSSYKFNMRDAFGGYFVRVVKASTLEEARCKVILACDDASIGHLINVTKL